MRSVPSKKRKRTRESRDPVGRAAELLRRAGVTWRVVRTDEGAWLVRFHCPSGWRTDLPTPRNVPIPPVLALMIYACAASQTRFALESPEWSRARGIPWPPDQSDHDLFSEITSYYARDQESYRRLTEAFGSGLVKRLARLCERFFDGELSDGLDAANLPHAPTLSSRHA